MLYDLPPPTVARIQASLWGPDNPALFVPQVFGVGWSVNLAGLARPLGLGPRAADGPADAPGTSTAT